MNFFKKDKSPALIVLYKNKKEEVQYVVEDADHAYDKAVDHLQLYGFKGWKCVTPDLILNMSEIESIRKRK